MAAFFSRSRLPAHHPCRICGKAFTVQDGGKQKLRTLCSQACRAISTRKGATKQCIKCKQHLPYEAFTRLPNRCRPASCTACYQPRKSTLVKLREAPAPCMGCKQRFSLRIFPSKLRLRKSCSPQCATDDQRIAARQCTACRRTKPADAFSWHRSGRKVRRVCSDCCAERDRLRENGLGYRQSRALMERTARAAAARGGVPFTLTADDVAAVYAQPCELCGAGSCFIRRVFPELGFITGNVEGCCSMCGIFAHVRTKDIDDDVVVAHARAIVRHRDGG